jgi:chemotaxis family two-component system response regulator Rcp1
LQRSPDWCSLCAVRRGVDARHKGRELSNAAHVNKHLLEDRTKGFGECHGIVDVVVPQTAAYLQELQGDDFALDGLNEVQTYSSISCLVDTAFNILVAEDNEDDLFLLRQAFKKAEVPSQLHHVNDGMEALTYLKGEAAFNDRKAHPFPDILLLDLNMPRKNGFEVLEWIRQDAKCSRLVVHVFTSSSHEADVRRAYDLHANTFLLKPSRVDELVTLVTVLHQWHRFVCLLSPEGNQSEKLVAQCGSGLN